MKAKIIQFRDCIVIITDEPIHIPGTICRHTKHFDSFPPDSLLVFNCKEEVVADVLNNEKALQQVIELYFDY